MTFEVVYRNSRGFAPDRPPKAAGTDARRRTEPPPPSGLWVLLLVIGMMVSAAWGVEASVRTNPTLFFALLTAPPLTFP